MATNKNMGLDKKTWISPTEMRREASTRDLSGEALLDRVHSHSCLVTYGLVGCQLPYQKNDLQ